MESQGNITKHPVERRTAIHQRTIVLATAVIVALTIWIIATPIAGVTLEADTGGGNVQHIGIIATIAATMTSGMVGWALLAILEKTTRRASTVWTVIAILLLLLSLLGAWGGVTAEARVTLLAMHLAVGMILIVGFLRASPYSPHRGGKTRVRAG